VSSAATLISGIDFPVGLDVLLNARHHAAERGERLARHWIDPYSSAPWFDGWRDPIRSTAPWLRRLWKRRCPTAPAKTWLLTEGWRRHGLLAFDEVRGPRDTAAAATESRRTRLHRNHER